MPVSSRWVVAFLLVAVVSCAGSGTRKPETEPQKATSDSGSTIAAGGEVRWRAALLQAEDMRRVNDSVREGLSSADPERRGLSVRSLGRIGDPENHAALLAAIDDEDSSVRAEAAFALGMANVPGSVQAMSRRLTDPDADVRTAVALSLGLLGSQEAIEPLIELLTDEVTDVRIAASYSTARFEKPGPFLEILLPMLEDPDDAVSRAALYGLSRISGRIGAISFERRSQLRSRLIQLSSHKDWRVRTLVAESLYNPTAGEQADTLAQMLADSDEVQVQLAIIRATSFPGAPTFVIHEKTLLHREQAVVYATLRGLARMRGELVTRVLVDFIVNGKHDWLQAEAIRALNQADRRMALRIANGLTNEENPMILAAAAETLYGQTSIEAATYAHRVWASEHPWVRYHAIPAMGTVVEPLTELFAELIEESPLELKAQMARAAGYRLAMEGRPDAIYEDALKLLGDLWSSAIEADALGFQMVVLDAAVEGKRDSGRELARKGLKAKDFAVRSHAAALLDEHFGERVEVEPVAAKPLGYYEAILDWSTRRHAALITMYRPGFEPGWFTIALDSKRAPMTAWRFSQLAQRGYYDQRRIGEFIPGLRLHSGQDGDNRYTNASWRPEPLVSTFPAGTVAAVTADRDVLLGEWLITMDSRPNYLGRYLPFGRVVQNLPGTVGNILPIDQVVSVEVYEGTGSEPVPQQPRASQ